MAGITLRPFQRECVDQLESGKVLAAGVGAGKSIMALTWYLEKCCNTKRSYNKKGALYQVLRGSPGLVIITTPQKRDNLEWNQELALFALSRGANGPLMGDIFIKVDSWNNIVKYVDAPPDTVFIFDEHQAIGSGTWSKAFVKIAKSHRWIILSATPGDNWQDWCPVMVADGYYRNRTEFFRRHAVYSRYVSFPQITKWMDVDRLEHIRDEILVTCEVPRNTTRHIVDVAVPYDKDLVRDAMKNRWNPETCAPFVNAAELCAYLRRVVNTEPSRLYEAADIVRDRKKVIIFYTLRVEMEQILGLEELTGVKVYQHNGDIHDPLPEGDSWIYAVQYNSGSKGWNCTTCDTVIYWDLPYSYKDYEQAAGRIDRLDTPYKDLYYYRMRSVAKIDLAIMRALKAKKDFNIRGFARSSIK